MGVVVVPYQNRPLSLPSVPTYSDGVKSPTVAVACTGMSEEENSTPAVALAVLNHREIVWELELPRPRSGSWTYEDVPLKPAAVEVLLTSGPAWPRVTLLYVALSTPSRGRTALAAVVPEASDSGQNEFASRSRVWLCSCEALV